MSYINIIHITGLCINKLIYSLNFLQNSQSIQFYICPNTFYIQYEQWDEIYDDICNGYDDCCSKEILYKSLKPTNIAKKIEIYETFKRCIPNEDCDEDDELNNLYINIKKVFTQCSNEKVANIILDSFKYVVKEKEVN